MSCHSPVKAFRDSSGKVFFYEKEGTNSYPVPCGRCIGCRVERSLMWSTRCVHEAQMHELNCFVTLTYEKSPITLVYRDFQLFMKRLREHFKVPIRFFMCGEYGEKLARPHYHAILFGIDFVDRVRFGKSLYLSATLDRLWGHGFASVGSMTAASAGYVARYSLKKINGPAAQDHYRYVNHETGEVIDRVPELSRMSLKPGIGAKWYSQFKTDIFPAGELIVSGKRKPIPRYYKKLLKREDREMFDRFVESRVKKRVQMIVDGEATDDRVYVRGVVEKARVNLLKRNTFGGDDV